MIPAGVRDDRLEDRGVDGQHVVQNNLLGDRI
jgi:hypothetical protein